MTQPSTVADSTAAGAASHGAAPAPAHEPTRRDLQRAVLNDLVELATECSRREAELEQQYQAELEDHARKQQWAESELTRKFEQVKGEIQRRHDDKLAEIDQIYQRETHDTSEAARGEREQIDHAYETATHDVKDKVNKAVWLADSVLEGTQNQIRAELKKARESHGSQGEVLETKEQEALALLERYNVAITTAATEEPPATEVDKPAEAEKTEAEAQADVDRLTAEVQDRLDDLKSVTLPKLFVGIRPYLLMILILIAGGIAGQVAAAGVPVSFATIDWKPKEIGIGLGSALVFGVLLGFLLNWLGKKHIRSAYEPFHQTLGEARAAVDRQLDAFKQQLQVKAHRAERKRSMEVMAVKQKYAPVLDRAQDNRDRAMTTTMSDYERRMGKSEQKKQQGAIDLARWREQKLAELQARLEQEQASLKQRSQKMLAQAKQKYDDAKAALEHRWYDGLRKLQAPIEHGDGNGSNGNGIHNWSDARWKTWQPPRVFPRDVRLGELEVDLKRFAETNERPSSLKVPDRFNVPTTLAFPQQASLMIHTDREGREEAIRTLQMVMARLLTSLPAGRARFTLIDPVGLGQSFAGFMHLADHDETLVGGRILTDAEQIDQRMRDLTEHMETVIQKYLRNEFATIDEYNAQAGELAEPYRFIVAADFPAGFSSDAFRRLSAIAASGARCGVYVLVARDSTLPLPSTVRLDDIEANSLNLVREDGKFIWQDDVFRQFPLRLDTPPGENSLTQILHVVGQHAKDAKRVEVAFESIAPTPEKMWSRSATDELTVPIGRMGATRLQEMKLGKGVAQHVLIAGKTGSGKSTLLHVMATNLALWYSPQEVEFYLVDFKKGVEFKTYATNELPHARAIAVESDREFGLSVLQRLDAELIRRGELFRKLGVQDLAAYRREINSQPPSPRTRGEGGGEGPAYPYLPRTLLIIDEFQEFFSEDDKLAQDASVLIDRLVRQGRAFGIHVLLGSQTIGGAGLPRSTLGQMAVRIALQTSEADSQLILGDSNSAARLLTRPGESIYNDQGGLVEANSPFQISWLNDEKRDQLLHKVRAKFDVFLQKPTAQPWVHPTQIIFEGNAPAPVTQNRKLADLLAAPHYAQHPGVPLAYLGEPVAIKDPTAVPFRRQSGANALIIGQQEESALAMMQTSLLSLGAQLPPAQASFYIFDGTPADSTLVGSFDKLKTVVPHDVKLVEWRETEAALTELADEMKRREADTSGNFPALFVFIYGLQRYRVLRKQEDSFSFGSSGDDEKAAPPDKQFSDLLREGPNVGIHIITWADTPASVDRTLDRSSMREFDHRILFQMSANDSSNLIDSPAANKLGLNRALAYSEEQGVMEKFRPYAMPTTDFLQTVKTRLKSKK
ncbi:MAG TPA: FtsK/SpoIIIE domain-containing protein [Tepidisphaeraceae bacterium]